MQQPLLSRHAVVAPRHAPSAPSSAEIGAPRRHDPIHAHAQWKRDSYDLCRYALTQIRAFGLSADPRTYEVWYTYAGATHALLNGSVNELVAHGGLSAADVHSLYEEHLSPWTFFGQAERIGGKVVDEIELIVDLIEATIVSAAGCRKDLAEAGQGLEQPADRSALRRIVHTLLNATHSIDERIRELEDTLSRSSSVIAELALKLEAARADAHTDPVSNLPNRRYFDHAIEKTVKHARKSGEALSIFLLDLDNFKVLNDDHGHRMGDHILRLLGATLKELLRPSDIIARFGGDEFAVILPATGGSAAYAAAEKIRGALTTREMRRRSTGELLGKVTVSIGVAEHRSAETAEDLIGRADANLYRAKAQSRNVVVWE